MIIIGLTGGMGCGKTTAAARFLEEGYHVLDTDAVVHQLLAGDTEVKEAVKKRFGASILDPSGAIDRRALGARVFAEERELEWLEKLLHPRVREIWRGEVSRQKDKPWVIQIPLLFEKKLEQFVDLTVCVGASAETQRRRLLRRGFSDEEIVRRISRQLPIEEKTARADVFLLNDGSLEFLREQVDYLCGRLRGH